MSSNSQVLVVGAGPTGLVLALWLTRRGVPVRIIDRHTGPGLASRAMAVQARTLEFYGQLGFADEVVAAGIRMDEIRWRFGIRDLAVLTLKDAGKGVGPYAFVLSFPQDDHEKLLGQKLREAGLEVEWNTELVGFEDNGDRVRATLKKDGQEETVEVAYLCGCDGAHSTVRHVLNMDFPGGTYEQVFYVADVEATMRGGENALTAYLGTRGFVLVFPIRSTGMKRLIGIIPPLRKELDEVTFEDVRPSAEKTARIKVQKVNWFSTYRVHHRVAGHFRRGRVFLAGDAGHIHSPAGGQGMNTGIGDAVNLAWKLAAVLKGESSEAILESYEPERLGFAQSLVASTDRAFQLIAGKGRLSQLARRWGPRLFPVAFRFLAVRRATFLLLSQTRIQYQTSPLSVTRCHGVMAGDRLPWVQALDNYALLSALNWQFHVFSEPSEDLRKLATERSLPVHVFQWGDEAKDAGFLEDGVYLVRPDGHLGQVSIRQDTAAVNWYCDRWGIRGAA